MADSDALRMRRSRAHKAGDHSLCRRCAAVNLARVPDLPAGSGEVTDAPLELRQLAYRLVTAHEADPSNAVLARELRMTLTELIPKGDAKPDADLTGLFGALQA